MTAAPSDPRPERTPGPAERLYLLDTAVQRYAWGSPTVIPELIGVPASGEPVAELWVGAHPGAPSTIAGSEPVRTLAELIRTDPEAFLGPGVDAQFGQLPYLLKVLAVERPLSLQAHPSMAQAEAGFAAEAAVGLAADAPGRNYKDANHKPEQVCALTRFEGLCGFRPVQRTAEFLTELTASDGGPVAGLRTRLLRPGGALQDVVTELLIGPAAQIEALLGELIPAARRLQERAGRWAPEAGWLVELDRAYPADRGTVLAALLNLVVLAPGEALFLGAGELHAYLRGVAVEVMANSDNVLRGGLSPKNIDAPALLAILDLREETVEPAPSAGPVGSGRMPQEHWYPSAVPDFRLGRFDVIGDEPIILPAGTPRVLLCTDGAAIATPGPSGPVELRRGGALFAPAGTEVRLFAADATATRVFGVMPNTSERKT